ncbi:hypothetical protein OG563_36235 [Nocardia vinacea]|uniref:Uncharacterized protein n=1 Tax=Nocardia vinacea TaxID=96468 RepID=A0ABZ1YMX8_9NOCA|nr:hypothetical protein [Nocardia vinacea]
MPGIHAEGPAVVDRIVGKEAQYQSVSSTLSKAPKLAVIDHAV